MAKTLDQILQDQLGSLLLANVKLAAEVEALREQAAKVAAAAKAPE